MIENEMNLNLDFIVSSSSSSQYCAGQRLAPHNRTLGDLEWEVESTTVTHSSADWWDLLLPLVGRSTKISN